MQVNIGKHGLSAPGGRELGKFIDEHLGELPDILVTFADQIRGEKIINGLPTDDSGAVTLQHGAEADQVSQNHFSLSGRFGNGHGVRKVQPIFFNIFRGLV